MKGIVLLSIVFFLSGCSAGDWVNAAGELMQVKDGINKEQMNKRIRAANQ